MAKFLLVDDHPLFREALQGALAAAYPAATTVDAVSIDAAIAVLDADAGFDIVLLDLNMPGVSGFEGLLRIRGLFPRLPVMVVSGHEDARVVAEVLSHGAAGFVPKSSRRAELVSAIQAVLEGGVYVPPHYDSAPVSTEQADRRETLARLATLTPKQMRVLYMLRGGLLNKQIAHELQVGETTVKAHVSEILRKLNVYSRTQAVIEMSRLDAADLLRLDAEAVDGSTPQPSART